jgi:site-specific DNA-methyltransferase (adenine-specific)
MKLFNGDCLEAMDLLIAAGEKVDAIITDPPYGTTACRWDSIIPFDEMWPRLNKLVKPNGAIVLFGSEPFSSALRMSNIKNYKYDWIWYKNNPTGISLAGKQPMRSYENISVFEKNGNKVFFNTIKMKSRISDRKTGKSNGKFSSKKSEHYNFQPKKENNVLKEFVNPWNVLEYKVVSRANGTVHPTQKPVALMEYLIKTYTHEGETVLDFTMGSGTTGVACANLGRKFIGIELDHDYFNIAKKRITEAGGNRS